MTDWKTLQQALEFAGRNRGTNVRLADLAAETGRSEFHAHRALRAVLGETPKQFTLRLRVDRAAAALISSRASILQIALDCGFESHEAFCRAFRRRFGTSPSAYRKNNRLGPEARTHAELVDEIGPCVGLYHVDLKERRSPRPMEYSVSKQELSPQPVLVVRRQIRRDQIAATIGGELPKVFLFAQQQGIALSGFPITRYLEISMGSVTLETGMRVTAGNGEWTADQGSGAV